MRTEHSDRDVARSLLRVAGFARVAAGAVALAAPRAMMRLPLGAESDRPAAILLTRMLATRELAVGLWALSIAQGHRRVDRALALGLAIDAVDAGATMNARLRSTGSGRPPVRSIPVAIATSGAGVAVQTWALVTDRRVSSERRRPPNG